MLYSLAGHPYFFPQPDNVTPRKPSKITKRYYDKIFRCKIRMSMIFALPRVFLWLHRLVLSFSLTSWFIIFLSWHPFFPLTRSLACKRVSESRLKLKSRKSSSDLFLALEHTFKVSPRCYSTYQGFGQA